MNLSSISVFKGNAATCMIRAGFRCGSETYLDSLFLLPAFAKGHARVLIGRMVMRQGSVILAAANLAAIVFIAFAQQPSASFPELVIKNNGLSKTDTSNLIHRVNFDSRGSIVVIGSQSNRSQVWTIGPEQSSAAFSGNYMPIRAAQWISNREYLVTSSPQQMIIWDVKRGRRSKEIKTATIDGFPLACH